MLPLSERPSLRAEVGRGPQAQNDDDDDDESILMKVETDSKLLFNPEELENGLKRSVTRVGFPAWGPDSGPVSKVPSPVVFFFHFSFRHTSLNEHTRP